MLYTRFATSTLNKNNGFCGVGHALCITKLDLL